MVSPQSPSSDTPSRRRGRVSTPRAPSVPEAVASDDANTARSGTLLRGLALLDLLVAAGHPMSLAELSAAAELDQSTALRLLRTLEGAGRAIKVSDGKRYLASPTTLRPLPLLHPLEEVRREADPLIRTLAAKLGKTVVMVGYLGTERVVIDVFQTAGSLSPYYSSWLQGPLHASGPGKALLLASDAAQRAALLGPAPYQAATPHTITTAPALAADLALAERQGYVVVHDEYYDGLSAVAANFHTWNKRVVGCLSVTGHSADFSADAVAHVGAEILACTRLMPLQVPSLKLLDQLNGR